MYTWVLSIIVECPAGGLCRLCFYKGAFPDLRAMTDVVNKSEMQVNS
jgi:hypothetical protein